MVAVEYEGIHVGHLSVEGHSGLIAAHFFHAPHVFALGDDDGLCLLSECLHFDVELCFVEFWQLCVEDG